jgi:DNA-binding MarR family transcriptional regulator
MMVRVPPQPERDDVMRELISALQQFTVESDVFVDVFARAHRLGRTDLNAIMWISTSAREGQPLTVGELAQRLGLSPAAATALVDRLEAVGHVERTRDGRDRRRVTVKMNPQALELASAFFVPLRGRMDAAVEGVSDEDLVRTAAVVRQLITAVTTARDAALHP